MGLLSKILDPIFGGEDKTSTASQTSSGTSTQTSETTSQQEQEAIKNLSSIMSAIKTPAPRTEEANKLWSSFMDELLGGATSPGLKSTLQGQEQAMQAPVSQYQGILSDLMNNRGIGSGLLNPLNFSIGGGSPIGVIPKSNQNAISLLANLAGQNLATSEKFVPGYNTTKVLDYLAPLVTGLEALRYSIPSTTGTSSETGNVTQTGTGTTKGTGTGTTTGTQTGTLTTPGASGLAGLTGLLGLVNPIAGLFSSGSTGSGISMPPLMKYME